MSYESLTVTLIDMCDDLLVIIDLAKFDSPELLAHIEKRKKLLQQIKDAPGVPQVINFRKDCKKHETFLDRKNASKLGGIERSI